VNVVYIIYFNFFPRYSPVILNYFDGPYLIRKRTNKHIHFLPHMVIVLVVKYILHMILQPFILFIFVQNVMEFNKISKCV